MDDSFSASLNNFRELSPAVKNHLMRVYLTSCCTLLASALGAYLHMLWNIGGFVSTLGFIGCLIWFRSTRSYENQTKRLSLLFLSALLNGVLGGLIIDIVIDIDSSILITSFVGTAVEFMCFSAAAMLARRREYLYLGGLLSSCLSILTVLQSATSVFRGSVSIFKWKVFVGLMIYVVYIVVKTEEIIENAYGGDMDFVQHSYYNFFTNLGVVFLRILGLEVVMSADKKEKNKKKKKLKQLKNT